MCDTIDRCEEDQESVCEPRRQKGKEHRVADSESRTQAIHIRVLVWSPLVRGYACDRNHMTCCVIEDRWIYMVMFIKKVTLFCEYLYMLYVFCDPLKAPTPFYHMSSGVYPISSSFFTRSGFQRSCISSS